MKIMKFLATNSQWRAKAVKEENCLTKEMLNQALPHENMSQLRDFLSEVCEIDCPNHALGMSFIWSPEGDSRYPIYVDTKGSNTLPTFALLRLEDSVAVEVVERFSYEKSTDYLEIGIASLARALLT